MRLLLIHTAGAEGTVALAIRVGAGGGDGGVAGAEVVGAAGAGRCGG